MTNFITKNYYNMITNTHTHVTNPLYTIIIKLYYIYIIHTYIHTNKIIRKNKNKNNTHQNHTHTIYNL